MRALRSAAVALVVVAGCSPIGSIEDAPEREGLEDAAVEDGGVGDPTLDAARADGSLDARAVDDGAVDAAMVDTATIDAAIVDATGADSAPDVTTTGADTRVVGGDFRIAGVHLTQAVQTEPPSVPLVALRDGVLRTFVVASGATTVIPRVRVRLYQGGTLTETLFPTLAAGTVPTAVTVDDYRSSYNVKIAGSTLTPGLSVLVDVDPDDAVGESNEANNVFPASGVAQPLGVVAVPSFDLRLVPVIQSGLTADATEANKETYFTKVPRMMPIGIHTVDVHAPYTTTYVVDSSLASWRPVLTEIAALRETEGSTRTYYGAVKVAELVGNGGLASVGLPAAVGMDLESERANLALHELGHTLGSFHSPACGAGGADPAYPYAGGVTGVFGVDVATETPMPSTRRDFMGYCGDTWVSDYTYRNMFNFRTTAARPLFAVAPGSAQEAAAAYRSSGLMVWGRADHEQLVLEPSFATTTLPHAPRAGSRFRISARDASGATLFDQTFDGDAIADSEPEERHFAFVVPLDSTRLAAVDTIVLDGGGRRIVRRRSRSPLPVAVAQRIDQRTVRLRWDASAHPLAVVRAGGGGAVLSFARGGEVAVTTDRDELDVDYSDGVVSAWRRERVAP